MEQKENSKNLYNEELLKEVVHYANEICVDALGKECELREDVIVETIMSDNVAVPVTALGFKTLANRLSESPARLRQQLLIQVAGCVHDAEIERSTSKDRRAARFYTHWWLVGAGEIRRIISIPEVDVVLKILTIARREVFRPWVCPHGLHVISEATIVGRDFDEVYEEYSLTHQKANMVYWDNLPDKIAQGKAFYSHLPDWFADEIKEDPLVAFETSREICKWAKVASLSDFDNDSIKQFQRERRNHQLGMAASR